jgi:integrase
MTLNFFIQEHQNRLKNVLYLRYDHNGFKVLFSTKTTVESNQLNWLTNQGRKKINNTKPLNKKYIGHHPVNKDLNEQYSHIVEIIYDAKKLGDLHPNTVKRMYERIHSQSEVQTIIEGIDVMISKYRNELSESTVKNYDNNLRHNITGYNELKKKDHKLLDLNKNFELDFKNYLIDQGKAKSTIGNQIRYLKSLCAKLKELDIEVNEAVFSFERFNSNKSIFYLSEAELKRLRISNPKSKKLQEQKDIFIFQCYTGFRISDLNRFNVHMVSEDRRFIKTRAYKTDEQINIPILPEAFDVLEKYHYKLPFIAEQKYNKAIKTFLKELKFDRIIESENAAPLHEVCTSHTARKTFHSYAINTLHLSATEVSKITGTSPETINKHYAGADIEEIAKKMRGSGMKVIDLNID